MAIYVKTRLTSIPRNCWSCVFIDDFGEDRICRAQRPIVHLGRVDIENERSKSCPLRDFAEDADIERIGFTNPYTTRLIRSMKDLQKFAECFCKEQQARHKKEEVPK